MADNVLVVEVDHHIPDGWRQANVEDAEAHLKDILAQMGEWYIAQVEGGWVNGLGYGGNVVAEGHKELGHMVIIRCTEQIQGEPVRIFIANIFVSGLNQQKQKVDPLIITKFKSCPELGINEHGTTFVKLLTCCKRIIDISEKMSSAEELREKFAGGQDWSR